MYIIPTCWWVIRTIWGNRYLVPHYSARPIRFVSRGPPVSSVTLPIDWPRRRGKTPNRAWAKETIISWTQQSRTGKKQGGKALSIPPSFPVLCLFFFSARSLFCSFRLPKTLKQVSWLPYNETRLYLDGFVNSMKLCSKAINVSGSLCKTSERSRKWWSWRRVNTFNEAQVNNRK